MRPSASTLSYLHCTAALDLITNYLRIHPGQSVGRSVGRYRSVIRFVGIARSFVVARRYHSVGSVSSFAWYRSFVRSVSFVRSFRRSMSFARSFVVARRYRSVGSFVGLEESGRSIVVGSLVWFHPEATSPVHHEEVQTDRTGVWELSVQQETGGRTCQLVLWSGQSPVRK
jgi:hypothetical protein